VETEYWPIILQTIVIVGAIVAAIRHSEKRMATMETKVEHLEEAVKPLSGISRAVARLEGKLHGK
jgi:hypothetical protein